MPRYKTIKCVELVEGGCKDVPEFFDFPELLVDPRSVNIVVKFGWRGRVYDKVAVVYVELVDENV